MVSSGYQINGGCFLKIYLMLAAWAFALLLIALIVMGIIICCCTGKKEEEGYEAIEEKNAEKDNGGKEKESDLLNDVSDSAEEKRGSKSKSRLRDHKKESRRKE